MLNYVLCQYSQHCRDVKGFWFLQCALDTKLHIVYQGRLLGSVLPLTICVPSKIYLKITPWKCHLKKVAQKNGKLVSNVVSLKMPSPFSPYPHILTHTHPYNITQPPPSGTLSLLAFYFSKAHCTYCRCQHKCNDTFSHIQKTDVKKFCILQFPQMIWFLMFSLNSHMYCTVLSQTLFTFTYLILCRPTNTDGHITGHHFSWQAVGKQWILFYWFY